MQYPHVVHRLRSTGADEYGNPATNWTTPNRLKLSAMALSETSVYVPPGSDIKAGDRLDVRGDVYTVVAVKPIRSPARVVTTVVTIKDLGGV